MLKLLVFIALVFLAYRWYNKLKKTAQTRRESSSHRFDISRVEEAEFRDLNDDSGSVKNE